MTGTGFYTAYEIDDDRGPLYWEIAGPRGEHLDTIYGPVEQVYAWASERGLDITLYTMAAWLRKIQEEEARDG